MDDALDQGQPEKLKKSNWWWPAGAVATSLAGVAVVAGLFVYEHSLVSPTDLSRLDVAFFNVNGYIAVILFLSVIAGRLA